MEESRKPERESEPLVEPAPDEEVVRALMQSAHPVEFVESNPAKDEEAESDES
jgi:hypothetical protein